MSCTCFSIAFQSIESFQVLILIQNYCVWKCRWWENLFIRHFLYDLLISNGQNNSIPYCSKNCLNHVLQNHKYPLSEYEMIHMDIISVVDRKCFNMSKFIIVSKYTEKKIQQKRLIVNEIKILHFMQSSFWAQKQFLSNSRLITFSTFVNDHKP